MAVLMLGWATSLWTLAVAATKEQHASTVPESLLAAKALEFAWLEVGNGESGGNNQGPDIVRYRLGRQTRGSWCAAFTQYVFVLAAEALGMELPWPVIRRRFGAKRLYRFAGRAGAFIDRPAPGDLVCWQRGRGPKNRWAGHVGIVSRVEGDRFWSLEGNVGQPPAAVREFPHELGERRLIGFARV